MKDVISYSELVSQEGGFTVQRGMNYRPQGKDYSILLMSVREDAPYNDGFNEEGTFLFYEGENVSKREVDRPKRHDQPFFTKNGKLTNNGLFFQAAEDFKYKRRKKPEQVKVYEKINSNVWSDKGWFELIDAEYRKSEEEDRKVFKFILRPEGVEGTPQEEQEEFEFSRRIPTDVKKEVWERDGGKCVECGVTDNLQFDHVIPWSKGGSSTDPKNIQLLCGKHNLEKSSHIE